MRKVLKNESGAIHSLRERNEGCGKSWRASKHEKEGNPAWLAWRVCGEKAQEGLANGSLMYFLVSLEGEE